MTKKHAMIVFLSLVIILGILLMIVQPWKPMQISFNVPTDTSSIIIERISPHKISCIKATNKQVIFQAVNAVHTVDMGGTTTGLLINVKNYHYYDIIFNYANSTITQIVSVHLFVPRMTYSGDNKRVILNNYGVDKTLYTYLNSLFK